MFSLLNVWFGFFYQVYQKYPPEKTTAEAPASGTILREMRIIQTHEMADFDAVASLLGAYLLDEGAYPVLPHHLNRNVRSFLTLYGLELPFVENKGPCPRKDVSQINAGGYPEPGPRPAE